MKRYRNTLLIILLSIIAVLAVFIAVWALFFHNDEKQPLVPVHAPPVEDNAENIPDDNSDKSHIPDKGGSVSLTYFADVTVDLKNKSVSLLFANPGKSSHDMVLQIVIQDTVIVQSGTIKPGNQVKALDLLTGIDKRLSKGYYDGKFVIVYYDQNTGEKAALNTEIPVNIEVK